MDPFTDEVVVVTGGASGIGRSICRYCAERGAVVVVADRNLEGARAVEAAIQSAGGRAEAVGVDVSDEQAALPLEALGTRPGFPAFGAARPMELPCTSRSLIRRRRPSLPRWG